MNRELQGQVASLNTRNTATNILEWVETGGREGGRKGMYTFTR